MAYVDSGKKIDKALAFQRTDTFPLDRSSMFDSYADALKYATQDGTDSRAIGGTSYVGQVLTVYGPGEDETTEEVAVYVIAAVGESAALTKLASTSTTGDLDNDITKLQTALSSLQTDVGTLEGVVNDETTGLAATKKIADDAASAAATNATAIGDLQTAVNTTIPSTYATQESHDALAGRVTTAEGDIDSLETRATDLEARATSAEGRLDTAESDIDELQNTVNNLTGAFVYRGVSTTDPTSESGPTVADYTEAWKTGDVVVYGVEETYTDADGDSHTVTTNKEYVYNGTSWREIGDEGSHLTKSEAAKTYVELTHTVNGHDLSGSSTVITGSDIAVSDSDSTTLAGKISSIETSITNLDTDLSQEITEAIAALDLTEVTVGAGNTIESISETDGKVSVSVTGIQIEQSQVTGLADALAGKEDSISVTGAGFLKKGSTGAWEIDSNDYQTESEVSAQITSAIGGLDYSLTGVSANHTISSVVETDGKIEVTTQAIAGLPISSVTDLQSNLDTIDAEKVDYADLDSTEFSVGTNKAVTIGTIGSDKVSVSGATLTAKLADIETNAGKIDTITVAGDATTISNKNVDIPLATAAKYGVVKSVEAENGVTVASDGTMSVYSLNVSKLVQTDGETLTLDGGNAAGTSSAAQSE